jgi:Leucine-rich repeat (LRR) protein
MSFTNTVSHPDRELLVINSIYKPPIDFAAAIAGKKFKRLHVYGLPIHFELLGTLTHLIELRMQSTKVKDFSCIAGLNQLEDLVYSSGNLQAIDLSFAARSLTSLYLSRHRSLTDLAPIGVCKKLKSLTLRHLPNVRNHVDLIKLPRLEFLALWNLRSWPSLTGLVKAVNLRKLFLDQTRIEDGAWEILLRLKQLRFVSGMADAFGKQAAAEFKERRPEVEMIRRFPA